MIGFIQFIFQEFYLTKNTNNFWRDCKTKALEIANISGALINAKASIAEKYLNRRAE